MDQGSLVAEQMSAGATLAGDFGKSIPLKAVFWLKKHEDKEWFLYLASDQMNDSNHSDAYGEVLRVYRPESDVWLDLFQIKVIGADHPLVKAVLAQQQEYATGRALRLRGLMLGGVFVDEVYIYPTPDPVPA